jgi:hypothetical protein
MRHRSADGAPRSLYAPVVLGLLTGAVLLAGCGSPLWSLDQSVVILSPSTLSTVSVPFDVQWKPSGPAPAKYGVFVDTAPMAPGHGLADMVDSMCKLTPGCPNAAYLAGRGVYVTSVTHLTVDQLNPVGGTDGRRPHPVHTVTIVRMDGTDHRVGEASWTVEFHV